MTLSRRDVDVLARIAHGSDLAHLCPRCVPDSLTGVQRGWSLWAQLGDAGLVVLLWLLLLGVLAAGWWALLGVR